VRFIEHLKARGEGKEEGVPFFLHEKTKCYDFCRTVGVPTVNVLRRFQTPDDINLAGLPDSFVIKPSWESNCKGVMVLTATEDGYHDAMSGKDFTIDEVVQEQRRIYDAGRWRSKPTIVEEKIEDAAGHVIPEDYKAYAFQGEITFIVQMNRNGDRIAVAWFDGNFDPLAAGRVQVNEKYLDVKEPVRPEAWKAMLNVAKRASIAVPTPFASIDMYASTRGPLLGEITLVPGGFYHGKYFVMSEQDDHIAGKMWENALVRLGRG
jgi:hypothetical protein